MALKLYRLDLVYITLQWRLSCDSVPRRPSAHTPQISRNDTHPVIVSVFTHLPTTSNHTAIHPKLLASSVQQVKTVIFGSLLEGRCCCVDLLGIKNIPAKGPNRGRCELEAAPGGGTATRAVSMFVARVFGRG